VGVTVSQTTDEDLVRALYAEHAGALFGYVLRLTSGDRQRAEDVVQETLFRAWQHPEAMAPERGPVRGWLCTVARNLVVDGQRASRARPLGGRGRQGPASTRGNREIPHLLRVASPPARA
jgi:DNA-directed RNA polymerase specialized sigma24 family protein